MCNSNIFFKEPSKKPASVILPPVQPPAVVVEQVAVPPPTINLPGQVMVSAPVAVFTYQPPAQIPSLGDDLTINSQDVTNAMDNFYESIEKTASKRRVNDNVRKFLLYININFCHDLISFHNKLCLCFIRATQFLLKITRLLRPR